MTAPEGYTQTQTQNMPPEMMQLLNSLMSSLNQGGAASGIDYLTKLAQGDEDIFKQIEAPAYQQLEQGLAKTANRFSGVGAQDSSAFQNQLGGQVSQMATDLASQRNQLQTGAIDKLMNFSERMLGQKPYEYGLQEDQSFDWQEMIKILGPIIAAIATKNPAALGAVPQGSTQTNTGALPAR